MYKEKAVKVMKDYFGEKRFIEHTLKVLSVAEHISEGEGSTPGS